MNFQNNYAGASTRIFTKDDLQFISDSLNSGLSFEFLIPKFLDYLKYDRSASPQTISKYKECLSWITKHLPDIKGPADLTHEDITTLKELTLKRGCGPQRVNSFIFTLRKLMVYCKQVYKLVALDPKEIKPMRVPKREVVFLVKEEIKTLLDSIDTNTKYGLRMRALMETLLSTGGRISETLSLNRDSINFETKEAVIIVKGNKQLTIFFNDRTIYWIKKYLESRTDNNEALFVNFLNHKRLARYDLGKEFRSYAIKAGIKKKVTPHILRHTAATIMLENGCPLNYIQELLGHADIRTTASYYLGTDKRSLKNAHKKYLIFEDDEDDNDYEQEKQVSKA